MIDERLVICAVLAAGVHAGVAAALDQLPERAPAPVRTRVQVQVVEKTPPPPPPPEPEPPKPPEPPPPQIVKPITKPIEAKRPVKTPKVETAPEPVETPPSTNVVQGDATPTPVFGVSMESTTQAPTGTSVPVGNTTKPAPTGTATDAPKPLAAPAAAHEVTKMPLPQGRCAGRYTEAARAAAIEGVVVLDLVVDAEGRARDIQVVSGLEHGLTEAAVAALTACRFTPGERSGEKVPVRIRGFKIRFVLDAGD